MAYCRDQSREKLIFSPELMEMMRDETPNESIQTDREIAMEKCLAKLKSHSRSLLLERYRKETTVEKNC